MTLWALSDLHVNHKENREALLGLPDHGEDWLILGGDIGERESQLEWTIEVMRTKFARLFWVPGNHELWSLRGDGARGVEKYNHLVRLCRRFGVHTPEDEFVLWEDTAGKRLIAPLFLLYDYSFRPDHVQFKDAVIWAAESGVYCADEQYLKTDPYPSKADWCQDRIAFSEQRLAAAIAEHPDARLILVNHFPLSRSHVRLRWMPRFTIWCGTRATEDWHKRFPVDVVVYGHLHLRRTDYLDGVRFEEVSLGYPRDWNARKGAAHYLRQILPGPENS